VRLQLPHPAHAVLDLGDDLGLAVEFFDTKILAQLIDEGEEGDRLAEGDAAPLQPGHRFSGLSQRPATLQHEPRFADASLPGDEHHLSPPGLGLRKAVEQRGQLALTTDKGGKATFDGHIEAGPAAAGAENFECRRRRPPLHRYLAQVKCLKEARDQAVRGLADDHAPRPRILLQSRRQVGGVPHRGVVHAQVVADLPHDDRAGVDADAHLQGEAAPGVELLAILPHGALEPQSRMHRPPWAVLMGDRRPEQGHDAIAGVLVDRALEPVHLGGDPLEAAVDNLVHDLRIELLGERGEVRHVGEQHGDLAALPFEGAAGGEDLLGQMPGRVALDLRLLAPVDLRFRHRD
jgi:hypothetical protein